MLQKLFETESFKMRTPMKSFSQAKKYHLRYHLRYSSFRRVTQFENRAKYISTFLSGRGPRSRTASGTSASTVRSMGGGVGGGKMMTTNLIETSFCGPKPIPTPSFDASGMETLVPSSASTPGSQEAAHHQHHYINSPRQTGPGKASKLNSYLQNF